MAGGVPCLINLLSWLPGHSGFGSYVQQVVPGLEGLRLQLISTGQAVVLAPERSPEPPRMGALPWPVLAAAQHGLDPQGLRQHQGLATPEPELIS